MRFHERLQSRPVLYRTLRRVRMLAGQVVPPRYFPEVRGRVHSNDVMLGKGGAGHYRGVGDEAAGLVERAISIGERAESDVRRILDFGCGFGRVTRVLVERFGAERISVFDVDEHGPRFCASEFGVRRISVDASGSPLPSASYDLIWAGSVLTHLDFALSRRVTSLLNHALAPHGLLVVTTLGEESVRRLTRGDYGAYWSAHAGSVLQGLTDEGFCFIAYPYAAAGALGMTWMTKDGLDAFTLTKEGISRIAFWPAAWDVHQDVHVFQLEAVDHHG